MSGRRYTLEEIKAAFWNVFHESGEIWFSYLGDERENASHTEGVWQEFTAELGEDATQTPAPLTPPATR